MKLNMATVMMPGLHMGSTMRSIVEKYPQPSIRAASSYSLDMLFIKPESR